MYGIQLSDADVNVWVKVRVRLKMSLGLGGYILPSIFAATLIKDT